MFDINLCDYYEIKLLIHYSNNSHQNIKFNKSISIIIKNVNLDFNISIIVKLILKYL